MSFQRMDDTFVGVGNTIDLAAGTITLTRGTGEAGSFSIQERTADRMVLDGTLDGRKIRAELVLFPREKLLLVTRGFNWVQEYPFNR
jgi:hypothetical protein